MVPQRDDPQIDNEETYDQLISLIENSQGRLAPIIVSCDDSALRQRIIMRYEREARQVQIRPYRIVLGQEPSMRAGLEALKQQEEHLQQDGAAVFTVTGSELLLRVTIDPLEEQSELDKFFGYLQWTREGLREFRYPIVLWVTQRILREMSRRAPDFWSWRKAVLRFVDESPQLTQFPLAVSSSSQPTHDQPKAENLPPLGELQAEITTLTAKDPDAPSLATLYERLGQVYAQRISQGVARNLEQEREQAIVSFCQAIVRYQAHTNSAAEMQALIILGNFFDDQLRYPEAISCHQRSLEVAQAIGNRNGEADALRGLGNACRSLGQTSRAIDFYQQSLEIKREISDRGGEADALKGLGNAYRSLGKNSRAIDFYQQSLEIKREIGDCGGEGESLYNLGNAYLSLGQYQRALELYQQALDVQREVGKRDSESNSLGGLGKAYAFLEQYQLAIYCFQKSLEIRRKIGDHNGEASSLFHIAKAFARLDQPSEAFQHYRQAQQIYQALELEHRVQECDVAIHELYQIIPAKKHIHDLRIGENLSANSARYHYSFSSRLPLWVYGLAGLAIALLLWLLKR